MTEYWRKHLLESGEYDEDELNEYEDSTSELFKLNAPLATVSGSRLEKEELEKAKLRVYDEIKFRLERFTTIDLAGLINSICDSFGVTIDINEQQAYELLECFTSEMMKD